MNINQSNVQTSKTGKPFWSINAEAIGRNDEDRTVLLFLNPLWADAQKQAELVQGRNKTPQWTLLVKDYDRPEDSYDGTGAVWLRSGKLAGSFTFGEKSFNVSMTKQDDGSFELFLGLVEETDLADIFA